MNTNANATKTQVQTKNSSKISRPEIRRQQKATAKSKKSLTKNRKDLKSMQMQCDEKLIRKAEEIRKGMAAKTWRHLETSGKFSKNEKLSFISDDMLIIGCDIGSEIHYVRAIDTRGA